MGLSGRLSGWVDVDITKSLTAHHSESRYFDKDIQESILNRSACSGLASNLREKAKRDSLECVEWGHSRWGLR
jgi:hypothetical protein